MIKKGLWKGKYLYDQHRRHICRGIGINPFWLCKDLGITIFSSPFDFTAVDLLEKLDAPTRPSYEAIDLPLIRYVGQTGKPMIISTGMASLDEIHEAYHTAVDSGCSGVTLLHCVSGYPSEHKDANLLTIKDLLEKFNCPVGLSDHTLDHTTSIASIVLGGCMIEKHFTLDKSGGGVDDSFSLEPHNQKI